jgi:hypothetical protein
LFVCFRRGFWAGVCSASGSRPARRTAPQGLGLDAGAVRARLCGAGKQVVGRAALHQGPDVMPEGRPELGCRSSIRPAGWGAW